MTSSLRAGADSALRDLIAERIRRDGPITFREFMETALYHPEFGSYTNRDPALDYQTSPNVHPVFAWCIAGTLAEMWRLLDRPARFDVLECGAGSGRLARYVTGWLRRLDPEAFAALHYRLQDRAYVDPARAESLRESIGAATVEAGPELPAAAGLNGCILSNELLDAFPVHRVRVDGGRLVELRVGLEGDAFVDVPAEPSAAIAEYFERIGALPGEGGEAEVNLEAEPWLRRAAASLERGYVLTLDYGYEASELYAPSRKQGTLLTFHRHAAGTDPYARVGRQDITASVDFTAIGRAGAEAGLTTLAFMTQAEYLVRAGIGSAIARRPEPSEVEAYHVLRRAVAELTDMDGLGRIKVLLQGKGVHAVPGALTEPPGA
jgi:SAM-dependent MidA family methyltransferase